MVWLAVRGPVSIVEPGHRGGTPSDVYDQGPLSLSNRENVPVVAVFDELGLAAGGLRGGDETELR